MAQQASSAAAHEMSGAGPHLRHLDRGPRNSVVSMGLGDHAATVLAIEDSSSFNYNGCRWSDICRPVLMRHGL